MATTRELPTETVISRSQRAMMRALAQNVKARRRARGMTQPELAAAVGRSQGWVSQLEKGVAVDIPYSMVIALAAVLGVSVAVLTRQSVDG